jgi:hypothetical protein
VDDPTEIITIARWDESISGASLSKEPSLQRSEMHRLATPLSHVAVVTTLALVAIPVTVALMLTIPVMVAVVMAITGNGRGRDLCERDLSRSSSENLIQAKTAAQ